MISCVPYTYIYMHMSSVSTCHDAFIARVIYYGACITDVETVLPHIPDAGNDMQLYCHSNFDIPVSC